MQKKTKVLVAENATSDFEELLRKTGVENFDVESVANLGQVIEFPEEEEKEKLPDVEKPKERKFGFTPGSKFYLGLSWKRILGKWKVRGTKRLTQDDLENIISMRDHKPRNKRVLKGKSPFKNTKGQK
jgi:hypothetical protein